MILLNKTDCGTAIKGTGTLGCKVDINYTQQFFLGEKGGVEFDLATDTIDQATIDNLIQSEQLIVLPTHFSFDNASGETVYEELPSGVKLPVRNGLYEFVPMYVGSICLANALSSLNSKSWDLFMLDVDDSGNSRLWGEKTSNGKFKGYDTSLVYAENKSLNDGSTSTKTPLRIQLSTKGTSAMRSRVAYLSSNNSIDFANLNGVNDVILEVLTTLSTNFTVTANISCDGSTAISSNTDVSNWKITNTSDGSDVVPSGITYVNGAYVIAGIPIGTYTVKFYDKTNSKDVIVSSGNYYESDTITVTLT